MQPRSRNCCTASPSCSEPRSSVAVTWAPRATQRRAVATPVRASPTTRTRLPSSSIPGRTVTWLPQLQRGERKQRKNQSHDPTAHDDFRFAPAGQFEMMMQRRHAEDALACQPERRHLQNDRNCFKHKDAAHRKQEDLLLDGHGDDANGATNGQRTNVAHKDIGGMREITTKPESRAHPPAAEEGQVADIGEMLDAKIMP